MDDPAICRLLHGGGVERLLPTQPRRRAEGPVRRLRSGDASRLRFRPSACRRRRRTGRCRDRLDPRHAHAVRPHPARRGVGFDDDERGGAADPRALHRRGGGTGRRPGPPRRHDPERHPQRIHGAQHLHLPAGGLDAHRRRHLRAYRPAHAEVQLDLDFRLPHAGSRRDGGPRTRLHAGRRPRIHPCRARRRARHRLVCPATIVSSGRSA